MVQPASADDPPSRTDRTFRAVLYPHRSLGPKGFMVLMAAIGLVSFITGAVFWSMGAWPVTGFFGLDVALIYIAFRLSYRSGRVCETVEIDPATLRLTHFDASGKAVAHEFNTYWVRVLLAHRPDGRNELRLTSHGRELVFARFLTDDEREEFSGILHRAIQSARAQPA